MGKTRAELDREVRAAIRDHKALTKRQDKQLRSLEIGWRMDQKRSGQFKRMNRLNKLAQQRARREGVEG